MLGHSFYHSTTRKFVIMFGNIFNEIYVTRLAADKTELQQIKIPITYAPKQKWYALMKDHPADNPVVKIQLPRMGFICEGFTVDQDRKNNAVHKLVSIVDDGNKVLSQFMPVAVKFKFQLYVMSVNTDDVFQIVEQIVPFFNPDFNTTLDLIPGSAYKYDARVNMLDAPTMDDVYDGDFKERRVLTATFDFEIDGWIFGPIQKSGVIKRVQVDFHSVPGLGPITSEEMTTNGRVARIVVIPGLTADGQPTSDPNLTIPYQDINKEDDYGFITSIQEFQDGKRYDPVSGTDK